MSINGSVILKAALQVRLCILLLMIFSSPEIYSQRVDSLQVHFCIVSDTSDAPVVTNTIRVFSSQRHYLIAYQNNSNNACFLQTIAVLEQDTLQITVTAPGYQRLTTSLIPPYSKSISTIRLKGDRSLLPGVVVISSPSWIRGDTTFFRAGFFSQGEEQKLKDLIVKMPGFEITEGGDLLYNKARIEKIMIDGEELYADRVKLLLASFPVHVLKNIQVLENQSSSSLLKGLVNGNRTFVNLELKDDARARIFGDVAAGAGLSDRYLLDMTSFLVRGKVKIAFLANNNSTGTGVDWGEAIEQGNSTAPGFHEWLMTTRYLHTVNNFSSSRYIRNKKLDNRLQFNSSTGKNSRITTQAAVISDWQRQASFFNSRLLDGSSYLARSDSNNMTYRPFEAFINTTYTTNIREKQELKLDLGYLHNVSRGIQDTRYQEESTNYESNNSIRSTTGTLTAGIEYANRQLEDRALRLFGNFVNWNMRQDAVGRSPVWSDIFNVSDPGYNSLLQRLTNHAKISKLGAEKLIKTGKGTVSQSLTGEFQNFTIKSDVQLTDEGIRLPIIPLDQLQNTGLYRSFKILGQTNSTFRIQTLPLLVNIRYGLNYNYGSESSSRATQALPVYDLLISQRRAIRGLVHNYSVRLKQEAINLSFWNRQYYPVSIGSFRANRGVTELFET